MKKLLVLMMVLGLASTANAALTSIEIYADGSAAGSTIEVVTSGSITLQIYSSNDDSGLAYLDIYDNGLYTYTAPTFTTNAGDSGGAVDTGTYEGYNSLEVTVSATTSGTITPGVMMEVVVTAGTGTGSVGIRLVEGAGYTTVDTTTLNIVPEPVTIALLGLGGLFLRRRK